MKRRRLHRPVVGASPGTLVTDPDALPPRLSVFLRVQEQIVEHKEVNLSQITSLRDHADLLWVNVEGLGDAALMAQLGKDFGLHPLTVEDIINVRQRPKVEEFNNYQFIVQRLVNPDREIRGLQMSMVLGDRFLLTFCERPDTAFAPVQERLRRQTQRLRQGSIGYWAYALIDAVIDGYFPILEACGERVEALEEEVLSEARPQSAGRINHLKRDLLDLRRAIWPLRDELNALAKSDQFAQGELQTYLRDTHDHALMLIDILESLREIAGSLMDLYLSSMSNRMNEVMKVLTIISTIFIPLTFIAGIYGMNFNSAVSPYNMPELNAYWGYPLALASMAVTGIIFAGYIWRQGWFSAPAPLIRRE